MKAKLLEVQSLTKKFGGLTAVNAVSFNIDKSQIVSLIGPNGAGKTTIFSLITGLVRPTSGRVAFNGEDLTGLPAHRVAGKGIVTTFQKTKVFPDLTVLEGVMIGCHLQVDTTWLDIVLRSGRFKSEEKKARDRAVDILEYCNLIEKKDYLCKNLSYGEQRILEIAVAMAAEPRLILLDEPAAGLNPQESIQLMQLIYGLRDRGMTVLLVEHDMHLVMSISDKVVVLNFGTKIAEGTPKEVSADEQVIQAYLGARDEDAVG
ncbi:MAG: ABC transporter ATP-binding protein [Actinobacteria bacterium]|nr:ABC transporter ATP-binding protein [Actinomycetota bacterium]